MTSDEPPAAKGGCRGGLQSPTGRWWGGRNSRGSRPMEFLLEEGLCPCLGYVLFTGWRHPALTSLGPSAPWDPCRGDTARLCREVKPRTRPRHWIGAPPWVHLTTEGGWISTVPHRTGTGPSVKASWRCPPLPPPPAQLRDRTDCFGSEQKSLLLGMSEVARAGLSRMCNCPPVPCLHTAAADPLGRSGTKQPLASDFGHDRGTFGVSALQPAKQTTRPF